MINYIGPRNGEGVRVLFNGQEVARGPSRYSGSYPGGNGRIVIGRQFTGLGGSYSSVMVDELIFFNKIVTNNEINVLFNS